MTEKFTKINYRIIHFYDTKNSNIYNVNLFSDIINKGVVIKNNKLIQSKKNKEELVVIDVFQDNYISDIPNYFNQFYPESNYIKIIMIEEL